MNTSEFVYLRKVLIVSGIKRSRFIFMHCLFPLMLGGLIYIFFRSTELRMFNWFSTLGIGDVIYSCRTGLSQMKDFLPSWIYYSLPDALWVYSFSIALLLLWKNDIKKAKYWLLIPFITGSFVEILQGLKLFPGTFDFLDFIFTFLAFVLSILVFNYKFKLYEKTVH